MSELQIFENAEFGQIRTVQLNNETYFVGKDITDKLGYQNGSRDINRHVSEEDRTDVAIYDGSQNRTMTIINESGLYALILGSKLESAKRFKHWVTSEVLPTIRKHGVYALDELLNDPEFAIKAFTVLKEERQKNKLLQEENAEMRPKALFADAVSASDTSILIRDLAKMIRQNGINIGEKRLFRWLRENGYMCKNSTMPTQKSMELGLFEIIVRTVERGNGLPLETKTAKVTGKGQIYFINKFLMA